MPTKTSKLLRSGLWTLLICAGGFAALRWMLPLVIAWGAAALLEPTVGKLCRHGFGRGIAAGVCLIGALGLLCVLLWLPLHRFGRELNELWENLPDLLDTLGGTLKRWDLLLKHWLNTAPEGFRPWLSQGAESVENSLLALPGKVSEKLLRLLPALVSKGPEALLAAITCVIGTFFISASYPELLHGGARLLPERLLCQGRLLRRDLRKTLGRWLRAQLIMLAITFGVLSAAFLMLRVRYALVLALLTAVVDALPVLGTGTVLLPWAGYEFLTGGAALGVGLVITYAAVTVLHQSIQAKLLGDSLGLHPLAALASIYVGFQVWGVWGMLTFPLLAVVLKQVLGSGMFPGVREGA